MQKRVVIHWDINGTITAVDSTDTGTAEQNINTVIARSVSIDGNENYYDYLKRTDPLHYKRRSHAFTNPGEPGEAYAHYVPMLIESSLDFLAESFLRAIESFPDAIHVIRTFGRDMRAVSDRLKGVYFTEAIVVAPPVTEEFNSFLKTIPSNHLVLIQEDYAHWSAHGRAKHAGKQLIGDKELIQIFFDDNDCVHVRESTDDTHFVLVNTLEAMTNSDYYVNHLKRVIK